VPLATTVLVSVSVAITVSPPIVASRMAIGMIVMRRREAVQRTVGVVDVVLDGILVHRAILHTLDGLR
jgi:hypothetical protein